MTPEKGLRDKVFAGLLVACIMGVLAWAAGVQGSTYTTSSLERRTLKLEAEQQQLRDWSVEMRTDIKYIRESIEKQERQDKRRGK